MQDKYVLNCPFCGGTEVIESWQGGYGAVTAVSNKWGGAGLYHSICRNCGSVVRSYVKEPEKLLKKKDRRQFINFQFVGVITSNLTNAGNFPSSGVSEGTNKFDDEIITHIVI